jgi:hypothetical protein
MGFDLFISVSILLCPETGLMYEYNDDLTKTYNINNVRVPEHLRRFVKQRGHYLRLYTSRVTDEYSTGADNFLDKFPEWAEILEDDEYDDFKDRWTEEDHNLFKETLAWLVGQKVNAIVSWSY